MSGVFAAAFMGGTMLGESASGIVAAGSSVICAALVFNKKASAKTRVSAGLGLLSGAASLICLGTALGMSGGGAIVPWVASWACTLISTHATCFALGSRKQKTSKLSFGLAAAGGLGTLAAHSAANSAGSGGLAFIPLIVTLPLVASHSLAYGLGSFSFNRKQQSISHIKNKM